MQKLNKRNRVALTNSTQKQCKANHQSSRVLPETSPSCAASRLVTRIATHGLLSRDSTTDHHGNLISDLLAGTVKRYPKNSDIDRLYALGDAYGLATEFLTVVHRWASWGIKRHNLEEFYDDLHEEVVAEAISELYAAIPRLFGGNMSAKHIRNSLKQTIEAKIRAYLDELVTTSAPFAVLQARRRKERNGGDPNRPEQDRRPCDMPEVVANHTSWSGYYSHEWPERAGEDLETFLDGPDSPIDDRWWASTRYKCFVEVVRLKARELAKGPLKKAVCFIDGRAPN